MIKTLLITMAIVSMVCFMSCKDNSGDPISVEPPIDETPLTKDDSVMANAYLVRGAAETWAALNGGVYARDTREELPDGRSIEDLLPNGELLMNPYTQQRDSPTPFSAYRVGYVGYEVFRSASPYGYRVNGVGSEMATNIILLYVDPYEL